MIVEGKGRVCPKAIEIELDPIQVCQAESLAESFAPKWKHRTDKWGQSHIPKDSDLTAAMIGEFGEMATRIWAERNGHLLEADKTVHRFRGDGDIDFVFCSDSGQVKTSAFQNELLVRRWKPPRAGSASDSFILQDLKANLFVFCALGARKRQRRQTVFLKGWILTSRMLDVAVQKKSRAGEHINLVVPPQELESMKRLRKRWELLKHGYGNR